MEQNAAVTVVCKGQVVAATTTRGHFEIALQHRRGGIGGIAGLDAAQGLSGCEVRVWLSGFQPATIVLRSLAPGRQNIGWVTLFPLSDGARFAYTATTALAPKEARKAWEEGRMLLFQGKLKEAREALQRATSAHRAWPMVESLTSEVIRLNPYEFPEAFLHHAAASYNLGKLDVAERSVLRAIELDTSGSLPRAYLLLARLLIETNRRAEAEAPLARYLELTENTPEAEEGRALLNPPPVKPDPFRMY
ncbi:MAG: hypothetical protein U5J83_17095 [Bryobacterales bacterium]|nr:hypothetical protein [Bryobacterales bacterium]